MGNNELSVALPQLPQRRSSRGCYADYTGQDLSLTFLFDMKLCHRNAAETQHTALCLTGCTARPTRAREFSNKVQTGSK